MQDNRFSTVEEAIQAIRDGQMVIVADNEDRENEGDLVCAAEKITPEIINFMAVEARGLICMPISKQIASDLNLPLMDQGAGQSVEEHTAFTVSIDGTEAKGVTTGISAEDRAKTIKLCLEEDTKPCDLRRPGHIFPLVARDGGVLERRGHTEASVDLSRLAGFERASVICEIANPDGSMARMDELQAFAKEHKMPFITVDQLVKYRYRHEFLLERQAKAKLPTKFGEFDLYGYTEKHSGKELVALVYGEMKPGSQPLVRLHSECLTGDALSSLRCDCQDQLHSAQRAIIERGSGILIYLRQEGRGIGLINKIKAYELQDEEGLDTYQANHKLGFQDDLRDFSIASHVLKDFGINKVELLTNNPEKVESLREMGIDVVQRIPLVCMHEHNKDYLKAKKEQHQHQISL